ncbi:MAG: flagellar protein FlaG [Flavobacteriales bacterium]|jgi:flagellar protein FlaG
MEINASQVGQNFVAPRVDIVSDSVQGKRPIQDDLATGQQQAKDLSASAETLGIDQFEVNAEQLETAVSQLSEFVRTSNRQLNFSVDEGSNKQVVKVTDAESGKVIRQIPSKELLKLSERLQDLQTEVGTAVGLLFNEQV